MTHNFTVDVEWTEGLQGKATPRGVPLEVPFSVPAAFGGPGGDWTPEHFFAGAINACIMATFLSISKNSKLQIVGYRSSAKATMESTAEGLRMTRVELSPQAVVTSDGDQERAVRMLEKAESMCPISQSTTASITFTPSAIVQA